MFVAWMTLRVSRESDMTWNRSPEPSSSIGMQPNSSMTGSLALAICRSSASSRSSRFARRKPFADLAEPELATFRWVSWWNSKRLHQSLGCRTPEQIETEYHANQAAQAVSQ